MIFEKIYTVCNMLSSVNSVVGTLLFFVVGVAVGENLDWIEVVSGYSQRLTKAPGTVTVITSDEIERMGATCLEDVLLQVPGLQVSTTRGFRTVYAIRGIHSQNNSDLLIKINNVPIRDPILGGRPVVFTMPVKNIQRIEIVRGPGSLVHGSDAIGGVINIITKKGKDLSVNPGRGDGYHLRSYIGSFNTYGGALQYGKKLYSKERDYALSIQAESTNGNDRLIKEDAQTFIDRAFGSVASHAPGRIKQDRIQIHAMANLDLSHNLKIRGGLRVIDAGTGVGVFYALSPDDSIRNWMGNLDIEYYLNFTSNIKLSSLLSYQFRKSNLDLHPLPEGSPIFLQGMKVGSQFTDHQIIGKTLLMVESFPFHRIQVGGGTVIDLLSDIHLRQNFLPGPDGVPSPLPGFMELRDVPGVDDPSRHKRHRFQFYVLGQDEWNFHPDWFLTTGIRMDTYIDTDEEIAISPRVALVHYLSPLWTWRLLYNRSFHMPSFSEQGFSNNGIKPEKIDMVEMAIEYKGLTVVDEFGVSAYWYRLNDMIVESRLNIGAAGFSNIDLRGVGGEMWMKREIMDGLLFKASYSFQRAVEVRTDRVYGMAPNHMVFGELNWSFLPGWNLNTQLKWVGERKRGPWDTRKPLGSYALLSLALQKQLFPYMKITFRARNLIDSDAREPSNDPQSLPGDIPIPGRSFMGIVDVRF